MTIDFSLSPGATKRIALLIAKRNDSAVKLRVSVESGGCSGFQYRYDFVQDDIADDDIYIEQDGAKVVIDKTSLEFIKGSMLEYSEELGGAYFHIKNPLAASGCGCGNSFSV